MIKDLYALNKYSNFVLPYFSVKDFLLLYLSGWNIKIRFLYTNLNSFGQELIAILIFSIWYEILLLEKGEDGVEERLEEERKGGGDDGGALFQSEFSSGSWPFKSELSQSACFDS